MHFGDSVQGANFVYAVLSIPNDDGKEFLFINTHLESHQKTDKSKGSQAREFSYHKTGVLSRAAQLEEIRNFTRKYFDACDKLSLAPVVGDYNWDDKNRKEEQLFHKKGQSVGGDEYALDLLNDGGGEVKTWSDSWVETRTIENNFDEEYTYDSKTSMNGNSSSCRKRIDRIVVYQPPDPSFVLDHIDCFVPEESKMEVAGAFSDWIGEQYIHFNVPLTPSDHYALFSKLLLKY